MTTQEQIAFQNGLIVGATQKGFLGIKGESKEKPIFFITGVMSFTSANYIKFVPNPTTN